MTDKTLPGKKLGLGVLGLGEGRSIISAGLRSELWDVMQVCDINEELCRARCAEFWTPALHNVLRRHAGRHGLSDLANS